MNSSFRMTRSLLRNFPDIRPLAVIKRCISESYFDPEKGISEGDGYIHFDGGPLTIGLGRSTSEADRERLVGKFFTGYPEIISPGKAIDSYWRRPDSPIMIRMDKWLDKNWASSASDRFEVRYKLPLWTNCCFPGTEMEKNTSDYVDLEDDDETPDSSGAHWKWALITKILGNLINNEIIHSRTGHHTAAPIDVDIGPICDFVALNLQKIFSSDSVPEKEAEKGLKDLGLGYLWPEFHSIFQMTQHFKNGLYNQNKMDEAGLEIFAGAVKEFWLNLKDLHGEMSLEQRRYSRDPSSSSPLSAASRIPLNLRDLHFTMGAGTFPELMSLLHSNSHLAVVGSAIEVQNARNHEHIMRLRKLSGIIIRNVNFIFKIREDLKHPDEAGSPVILNVLDRNLDFRSSLGRALKEHEQAVREFRDIYFGFRRTCSPTEMPMNYIQHIADVTAGSSLHFHTLAEIFNILERMEEERSVHSKFVFKFE